MRAVTVLIDLIVAVYAISIVFLVILISRVLWLERDLPLPARMELATTGSHRAAEVQHREPQELEQPASAIPLTAGELVP